MTKIDTASHVGQEQQSARVRPDLASVSCAPPEASVTIHVDDRRLEIIGMPARLPVRSAEIALLRALFGPQIDALIRGEEDGS